MKLHVSQTTPNTKELTYTPMQISMLDLIELKLNHWRVSPKINYLSFEISAASRPPPVNKCNPELCRMTKDGELATCKKQVSSKISQIIS